MLAALAVGVAFAGVAVGTPGASMQPARAAAVSPDLRVSGLTALDARTVNGGPLRLRHSVSNAGRAGAKRSRTLYLLSRDRVKSRTDIRLRGSSLIPRLGARRRARGTTRLTLGPRTPAGRYFVIGCADGAGSLREARETNNCHTSKKRVSVSKDRSTPRVAVTSPAPGAAVADVTPALTGTAGTAVGDSSLVTLRLYRGLTASGRATRTVTARARSGRWLATAAPALPEGTYTARAEQRDGAGHTGRSRASLLRVDVTAPQVLLNSTDARTTDPSPELRGRAGTAEGDTAAVTLNVYAGTAAQGNPVSTTTATGTPDWATATTALPEGTYTARAEQTDSAGNVGRSESRGLSIAPVNVIAAGDMACWPTHPNYNGGAGQNNECQQRATANVALAANPDLVLALGDLQYDEGELENFNAVYHPTWGRLKSVTRPASGNHEYDDPCEPACGFYDYFNGANAQDGPAGPRAKGWYSFDTGAWHVVVLNSECSPTPRFGIDCAAGSEQEQWLRADLAASRAACTAAIWHKPRFGSAGSHPALAPLWQALHDAGAELVLAGHAHSYERFAPQTAGGSVDTARGLRQFVVGTGGRSLIPLPGTLAPNSEPGAAQDDTYGVLQLTLHANSYDWSFLPAVGPAFSDTGSANCH